MKVERFIFGPFETNCYVVSDEQHILLVDPACSNEYERQQLKRYIENQKSTINNQQLSIISTHGHLDHLWGAKWATEQWNTPVLMHETDIPMAKAMQQQYNLFGIRATAEPFPIESLSGKAGLSVKRSVLCQQSGLSILSTPGHTPGSVCFYFPEDGILFSGDTLFQMGYGRTDLPGGNYSQLIDSLDLLLALPPETVVYPGHGDFTTIGAERR